MPPGETAPEIAYYYPEPFWALGESAWAKSLLLFFDEISILLPSYMRNRPALADPSLVQPLDERGLLRILEPDTFVDETTAAQLVETIAALVEGGTFDDLEGEPHRFAELSMSRMGYGVSRELAGQLTELLRERGLAIPTRDGVSIPMAPELRSVFLILLAELAPEAGRRQGIDLHPVAYEPRVGPAFRQLLAAEAMPSRGYVVSFDLDVLGVDLGPVPLDDILQFRAEAGGAHRRYMRDLREFAFRLSSMTQADRERALQDRQADLEDQARDLRERARQAWKSPKRVVSFTLGLAGAAWSIATLSPVPAALAALGAGVSMLPEGSDRGVYSYLFDIERRLT